MGKVGAECCKLLEKLGYVITGFIDNYINDRQVSYMGKKIQIPEKMQAGKDYIIIAFLSGIDNLRIASEKPPFSQSSSFPVRI